MSTDNEDLEIRLAYLDDTVEQLSQQLYRQSREIETLTGRCRRLEERIQRLASSGTQTDGDERPPHY